MNSCRILPAMRTLAILTISLLRCFLALFRTHEEQAIVELALRQQLAVYAQKRPRPKLSPLDRAFWVALSRLWPRWKNHLVVVRPETVVRWHRQGFRRYWRSISTPGPGRPPLSKKRKLIVRMATENRWRARKIQAELTKLGIRVSLATVSRYLPKTQPDPKQQQRWMTFLRNHKDVIAGMDFFVVPTVRFRLLYVWFVIDHGRRRILHFNVTTHPTARWVIQQLRETFPEEPTAPIPGLRQRRDLLSRGHPGDRELPDLAQTDGVPKSLAERHRRTSRRQRSPRAARSRGRLERRTPQTPASRIRRLLQRGTSPYFAAGRSGQSARGRPPFTRRERRRIPARRWSSPPICLA